MLYSLSFRRRALRVQEQESLTNQQTADRFGVGIATIARWRQRIEPKPYPKGRKGGKLDMEQLREDVQAYPDDYQYERAARFGVFPRTIGRALKRLGVTYKKNTASSTGRRRQAACFSGGNQGA